MSITLERVRTSLRSHDDQLFLARRLTRLRAPSLMGEDASQTQEALAHKASIRRRMVERVAREVIDNLLMEGRGPVAATVKGQLKKEFDTDLVFGYGVLAQELQVYKSTADGKVLLEKRQTESILQRLWQLTVQTVDDTMI